MLQGIFSLTLQATQGLFDTLLELMNVQCGAPDYSCVSKQDFLKAHNLSCSSEPTW
jgi:hypothetical protein